MNRPDDDWRDKVEPDEKVVCGGCYRASQDCVCDEDDVCSKCHGSGSDYADGYCCLLYTSPSPRDRS